jgi:sugar lactone lactonase YvrE
MRLRRATVEENGPVGLAMWHADRWCPLTPLVDAARSQGHAVSPRLAATATDLIALLAGGPELAAEVAALASVIDADALPAARLLPGLPFRPGLGPAHDRSSPPSFVGEGATLPWPAHTNALDYGLALGLVVVRPACAATPATAAASIGGVVLVNDVATRDGPRDGTRGGRAEDDAAVVTAVGPVVVTADEILPDIERLLVAVSVNGEEWTGPRAARLPQPVGEVMARATLGTTLLAGAIVVTGTLAGCSGAEAGRWLSPGDVVELTADRLGTLRNTVGEPAPWLRPGPLDRPSWRAVPRRRLAPDPVRRLDPERARVAPPPPLTGIWAADRALDQVERWDCPGGSTPKDILVDRGGRLYAGVRDGRIHRWPSGYPAAGGRPEVFADTHGRPSGLGLDPCDGTLVVCDAERGLLRVDARGRVELLADELGGVPLRFANHPAVRADGTVFFSDSSTRFGPANQRLDMLERRPSGRVLARSPSGSLDLLADGLYFPNGVALSPDASYLLVAETSANRVSRVWLAGWRAGQREVVLDNLPGHPDTLAEVGDGSYWMALPSLRVPPAERLLPYPRLRRAFARLPERLMPRPARYGLVARIDGDGRVLQTLHGPAGRYGEITGVREHCGWLYLGSLAETAVARVRLP